MKRCHILILLVLLPLSAYTDSKISFNGYSKNFFVVFQQPDGQLAPFSDKSYLGMVNQRFRLTSEYTPNEVLAIHVAYDLSMRIQDPTLYDNSLFMQSIDPRVYRVTDVNTQPYSPQDNSSFAVFQNVDRAYVSLSSFADFYVGRQAIAWGSARVINPTDIIAPFTFHELDKEERLGVDAVRMRLPIGFMGEIDAGYVFGKDLKVDNSAFFLRGKFYVAKTDVSLLALGFQGDALAGLDLSRAIGGAGLWLESAFVWTNVYGETRTSDEENYFRASFGADYSLTEKIYGFIEFHYNQPGARQPKDYLNNLSQNAYTRGTVYLLGQYYLAPGIRMQLTPLWTGLATTIFNITDSSAYVSPTLEYNVAENIYVQLGGYFSIGPSVEQFTPRSEFGLYPNTMFTSFRLYF